MATVGNGTRLTSNPNRVMMGPSNLNDILGARNLLARKNIATHDPVVTKLASVPSGTEAPVSWQPAIKNGGLASFTGFRSTHTVTPPLIMGMFVEASLAGVHTLTSNATLIVSMAAELLCVHSTSADIFSVANLAATLANSGEITASLNLIAYCVSAMTQSHVMTPNMTGVASMGANITTDITTGDLTASEVAAAVWNSLAATFNSTGTMGELLNSGGGGGGATPNEISDHLLDVELVAGRTVRTVLRELLEGGRIRTW